MLVVVTLATDETARADDNCWPECEGRVKAERVVYGSTPGCLEFLVALGSAPPDCRMFIAIFSHLRHPSGWDVAAKPRQTSLHRQHLFRYRLVPFVRCVPRTR